MTKPSYRCTTPLRKGRQHFMKFPFCLSFVSILFYVSFVSEVAACPVFTVSSCGRGSQFMGRNDGCVSLEPLDIWGLKAKLPVVTLGLLNTDVQNEAHRYLFIRIFLLGCVSNVHCLL